MRKIVECIPNFSEGQNQKTIQAIADSLRAVNGVQLLHVDSGYSANRTVYTFVGNPDAIIEGAIAAATVARERIDMRKHHGEHLRLGAMDVCPFVPISGVSMVECVEISRKFAARAAQELDVPFFLYEHSASQAYRTKLADIRKGEYEALPERLQQQRWQPDYGPTLFVPEWGASITGARNFLIAYNVNILGTAEQAHHIACDLRESGRGNDNKGKLPCVKAMGWFIDEYNMAQITANLTDFAITPMHTFYEEVKKSATDMGIATAGSEIIGLVPLQVLLIAADYYLEKEQLCFQQEEHKLRVAIERMGLNAIAPFVPEERIIEYRIAKAI